jgi:hypothetical protein
MFEGGTYPAQRPTNMSTGAHDEEEKGDQRHGEKYRELYDLGELLKHLQQKCVDAEYDEEKDDKPILRCGLVQIALAPAYQVSRSILRHMFFYPVGVENQGKSASGRPGSADD